MPCCTARQVASRLWSFHLSPHSHYSHARFPLAARPPPPPPPPAPSACALASLQLEGVVSALAQNLRDEHAAAGAMMTELLDSLLTKVQAARYLLATHPFCWNGLAFALAAHQLEQKQQQRQQQQQQLRQQPSNAAS